MSSATGRITTFRKRASTVAVKPRIDDIQSDAHHLYELLDVVTSKLCEADEDQQKEQIMALAWIARDVAERLAGDLDRHVETA